MFVDMRRAAETLELQMASGRRSETYSGARLRPAFVARPARQALGPRGPYRKTTKCRNRGLPPDSATPRTASRAWEKIRVEDALGRDGAADRAVRLRRAAGSRRWRATNLAFRRPDPQHRGGRHPSLRRPCQRHRAGPERRRHHDRSRHVPSRRTASIAPWPATSSTPSRPSSPTAPIGRRRPATTRAIRARA